MTIKRADQVAAILLLLFSGYVMFESRKLSYWYDFAPGSGFLPFWLGVILAGAAVLLLVGSLSPQADKSRWLPEKKEAIQIGVITVISIVGPLLTYGVGMVLASMIYMAAVLWYLEPRRHLLNSIVTVATPVIVYFMFIKWLAVPLPAGPFGF